MASSGKAKATAALAVTCQLEAAGSDGTEDVYGGNRKAYERIGNVIRRHDRDETAGAAVRAAGYYARHFQEREQQDIAGQGAARWLDNPVRLNLRGCAASS
ncbi:hypothetical protein EV426DRAFT_700469 [Tirmania nivea]|nr:hypothetical protein EV426DRAFT_700469 [Tirmania nivea]